MKLLDYISLSWKSLWERKGRTIGAIIGIAIAVVALGTVLGLVTGTETMFMESFSKIFGVNTIYLIPALHDLTEADVKLIESIPSIEFVIPLSFSEGFVNVGGRARWVYVIGIEPEKLPRLMGATSIDKVVYKGSPVLTTGTVFVGYYIAYTLTGEEIVYPGQRITIISDGKTIQALVTGILVPFHATAYGDPNVAVFMDINSYFENFKQSRTYDLALIFVKNIDYIDNVVNLLRKLYPNAEVFSLHSVIESFMSFFFGLKLTLGVIAAFTALVVGLWIFDTMTISILQRTREIGIMKAIGFTGRKIFTILLSEVIILTLIGEVLGLAILSSIIQFLEMPLPGGVMSIKLVLPITSALITITIPLAVNILASLAPAFRAVKISAAQALRYE